MFNMNDSTTSDFLNQTAKKNIIAKGNFNHWILLMFLPIVILNILAFVSLKRCKHMCKQIKVLSLNLTLTDISFGCSLVYGYVLDLLEDNNVTPYCWAFAFEFVWSSISLTMSFVTVTLFGIDRFLALYFTFRYYVLISKNRCYGVFLFLWCLAIALYSKLAFDQYNCDETTFQLSQNNISIISLYLAIIFMLLSYIGIMIKIKKEYKFNQSCKRIKDMLNWKPLVKISTIVVTFYIMYIPLIVYTTFIYVDIRFARKLGPMRNIVSFMLFFNSWINPILYAWRFKECRYEMLKIVCIGNTSLLNNLDYQVKIIGATFLEPVTMVTCASTSNWPNKRKGKVSPTNELSTNLNSETSDRTHPTWVSMTL